MAGRSLQDGWTVSSMPQRSGFSYLPLWKSTFLSVFQLLRALREVGKVLTWRGVWGLHGGCLGLVWDGQSWPEKSLESWPEICKTIKQVSFFFLLVTLLAAGDGSGVGGTGLQWQFFLMHLGKQQRQVVAGKRLPLLLLYWVFERGMCGIDVGRRRDWLNRFYL